MNILTQHASKGFQSTNGGAVSNGTGERRDRRKGTDDRRASKVPDRRAARIFLRGTNLLPTGEKVQPCVAGTKQSILVDMLSRPGGATMEQLLEALSGGRKPWVEATVRSGFGWDMKRKGYGVRSEFDALGEERFHLVVPEGQKIPPHVEKAGGPPEKVTPPSRKQSTRKTAPAGGKSKPRTPSKAKKSTAATRRKTNH